MSSRVAWVVSALLCISACTRPQAAVDPAQASTVATTSPLHSLPVLVPRASEFTSAPLHNRVRVQLEASVVEVWSLVGDLGRLPEYSSGLEKVEPIWGADKKLSGYVCHFKPAAPGGAALLHKEIIRWYEPEVGLASTAEEPNAFGLANSFSLVTLQASGEGTVVTWEQYYDAGDLESNKVAFDQALADIAGQLSSRFGGRIIERHVE